MNSVVNYITNLLGGTFLQVQIDRMLAEAALQCPHSESYVTSDKYAKGEFEDYEYQKQPSDSISFLIAVIAVIASLLLISFTTLMVVKVLKRRRLNHWMKSLSIDEINVFLEKQLKEKDKENRLNAETSSMFASPSIPFVVRIATPLVVLANIGFFLSGHLSLGASVDIDVQWVGQDFRIKELFVFSMSQSILDMWDAGAKELAVLILLFSGVWPYTKQLTVLILWFSPPRIISVARRKTMLLWLDMLGKWSFVDIFVLILSLASFRVAISTPDQLSYLPADFFKFNLLVIPCWGLYSNMIAQFTSQISSHFIIHYHRKIEFTFEEEERKRKNQTILDDQEKVASSPIYRHSFNGSSIEKGITLVVRPVASMVIILLSMLFLVLIICGCILPSYSLEQFGIIGLTSSVPYVEHSIFSTIKLLMDQARFTGVLSDQVGLSVLSSVLVLTVLIVPCFQLILSLVRWFAPTCIPLSKKTRLRLFVATEALAAWQYIEVYLFSIIIASWQLGSVSEFMINDYCIGLEDSFAMLQYFGILGINEAQCFRVSAKLESAMWILMAASVVLMLIMHLIGSAASQQEEDLRLTINNTYTGNSHTTVHEYVHNVTDLKELHVNNRKGTTDEFHNNIETFEHEKERDSDDDNDLAMKRKKLHLESVRFTDIYRCLLRKKECPATKQF
jgi:hypothetical protein